MVEELTKKIIRAAFAVHNYFGYGFSERVYQNSLVFELDDAGLEVSSEHVVSATYKNRIVGNYRIDILVEKTVVVELKTGDSHPRHISQVLNYLKCMDCELGLILYFNESVGIKRVIQNSNKFI
jgi:GxxExxY protein